jgi:hypothetical protein
MLSQSVRNEIEQLLAEGRSRREIARRLRVSRSAVRAVAAAAPGLRRLHRNRASFDDRPRQRCPSCEYLVPLPCVYCRASAYRARRCARSPYTALEREKHDPLRRSPIEESARGYPNHLLIANLPTMHTPVVRGSPGSAHG